MDIESGIGSSHWWPNDRRKILKVPLLLRQEEGNCDAYDPKVVSFGPYHHGKPELQLCQEMKHVALQMFVEGANKSPGFFYNRVLGLIGYARNCYVDGSTDKYCDEEFAEMMFLDACFLIYVMNIGTPNPEHRSCMSKHLGGLVFSLANRDIFLMENQIPFTILTLLIDLRYDEEVKGEEEVIKFFHKLIWSEFVEEQILEILQMKKQKEISKEKWPEQNGGPLHLFEAVREVLVWDWAPQSQARGKEKEEKEKDLKKHHKTFRSATDLKARGIHFRPSDHKFLKDINFKSFPLHGQLQLPIWFVTSLSKVFFLNLIAYELCPNNTVEMTVVSYVNFMKSLIDSPADVKELRENGILFTKIGSDEDVVRLYGDLNTHGISYTPGYEEVEQRILDHYYSKPKTWMAELITTHFNGPWSIIAFLVGVIFLLLTLIQTHFTVNPTD